MGGVSLGVGGVAATTGTGGGAWTVGTAGSDSVEGNGGTAWGVALINQFDNINATITFATR